MLSINKAHAQLLLRLSDAALREVIEQPDLCVSPDLYARLTGGERRSVMRKIHGASLPAIKAARRNFTLPNPTTSLALWRQALGAR